jgi:cobalt transporter subunit CbtB
MIVAVFGAVFTYGSGFAGADVLHNAAHDARHANNFPCH